MQSCVVDGLARDLNLGGTDSLANVLNCLSGDLAKSGRFISSLRVNGREVADIEREAGRHLDGIDSIEITTGSRISLAKNIIAEGKNYIEGLQDYLLKTAGRYTSGSECADNSLLEAVQGMQWFIQMVGFIEETLNLDYTRLMLNGNPVDDHIKMLNIIFQEIVNSQEKGDAVLLADILEYDLVPQLDNWKDIFTLFEGIAVAYSG